MRPGSVHVLSGYEQGEYAGHARARSFVVGPGFAVQPGLRSMPGAPADADWAVLTLRTALGAPDRVLALADAPPTGPVMLGGYEQDRAQVLVADVGCRLLGLVHGAGGRAMLQHSCAATRGASGGPLLAREAGQWVIVGVNSTAQAEGSGGLAVPVSAIDSTALSGLGASRMMDERRQLGRPAIRQTDRP